MSEPSECPGGREPAPHHPHRGNPNCWDDPWCGCDEYLWCHVCGEMWPCDAKQAHVAARKAAKE